MARMPSHEHTHHDRALEVLRRQGVVRLRDFAAAGIAASTIARMQRAGDIERIGRGLYHLPGRSTDANHDLAVVAKAVPSGVVCLVSALAFHELTDMIPARVWIAVGPKDRKPTLAYPALQIVRFSAKHMRGIGTHVIDGVAVRITDPVKTVVDLFRYRQSAGKRFKSSPGLNLALEGLRELLRERKATPAEIAACAEAAGAWKVIRPYLEAMTANA